MAVLDPASFDCLMPMRSVQISLVLFASEVLSEVGSNWMGLDGERAAGSAGGVEGGEKGRGKEVRVVIHRALSDGQRNDAFSKVAPTGKKKWASA